MTYADFYDIALHASINWNGKFTPKEIACYAYDYLCEFETSKRNGEPTEIIKTLCENLEMDVIGGDLDAEYWLENIKRELNMAEIKVARIVFKNKNGWSTGKHAFHKGTEKALNEWAIKKARGREFQVQILDEENALHFWDHAIEVEEE